MQRLELSHAAKGKFIPPEHEKQVVKIMIKRL